MNKPFSPACERNKEVILSIIAKYLTGSQKVLEVGSGTGQHGIYFAENLPHVHWHMSDRPENIKGINAWVDDSQLSNVHHAIEFDVSQAWPAIEKVDCVYTANTLHIMAWRQVEQLFSLLAEELQQHSMLMIYGPFNYQGAYTSASNAEFDQHLKQRHPDSAIRDFEAVEALAQQADLLLQCDLEMPANNRLLIWKKH